MQLCGYIFLFISNLCSELSIDKKNKLECVIMFDILDEKSTQPCTQVLLNWVVQLILINFDFLFYGSLSFIYFGQNNFIPAKSEILKLNFFYFIATLFCRKADSSH